MKKVCPECKKIKPNIIIINTTIFTITQYLRFKESETELCIDCFIKK